jgi:hypothetical protein
MYALQQAYATKDKDEKKEKYKTETNEDSDPKQKGSENTQRQDSRRHIPRGQNRQKKNNGHPARTPVERILYHIVYQLRCATKCSQLLLNGLHSH